MRPIYLAAISLAMLSTSHAAPCCDGKACRYPTPNAVSCPCGVDCDCSPCECNQSQGGPARTFGEARPVRRLLGGATAIVEKVRPVRRLAAAVQNRPRLLRKAARCIFRGCR